MSDKPPGEGDPLLQEILRQLKDSFADVDQNPFLDSDLLDVLSQELSTSIDALIKKEKTFPCQPILSRRCDQVIVFPVYSICSKHNAFTNC